MVLALARIAPASVFRLLPTTTTTFASYKHTTVYSPQYIVNVWSMEEIYTRHEDAWILVREINIEVCLCIIYSMLCTVCSVQCTPYYMLFIHIYTISISSELSSTQLSSARFS